MIDFDNCMTLIIEYVPGNDDSRIQKYVYARQPGRFFTTTESGCPLPEDNIYPTVSGMNLSIDE